MLEKLLKKDVKVLHYCTSTMQVIKVFRKDRSRMKTLHSHNCPQESLHLFFGRNPYRITRLFLDNVFHFFVEFFWCVSLDDSSKVFTKLMLKLVCALIQFAGLKHWVEHDHGKRITMPKTSIFYFEMKVMF